MSNAWCPKCHSKLKASGVNVTVGDKLMPVIECTGKSCMVVLVPLAPKEVKP